MTNPMGSHYPKYSTTGSLRGEVIRPSGCVYDGQTRDLSGDRGTRRVFDRNGQRGRASRIWPKVMERPVKGRSTIGAADLPAARPNCHKKRTAADSRAAIFAPVVPLWKKDLG